MTTEQKNSEADGVLAMLRALMENADSSDTARIQAAKILLERLAPKEDDDARKREAEERAAALIEAKGLLAEFTASKLAGLYQPDALVEAGAAPTDNAAGNGPL